MGLAWVGPEPYVAWTTTVLRSSGESDPLVSSRVNTVCGCPASSPGPVPEVTCWCALLIRTVAPSDQDAVAAKSPLPTCTVRDASGTPGRLTTVGAAASVAGDGGAAVVSAGSSPRPEAGMEAGVEDAAAVPESSSPPPRTTRKTTTAATTSPSISRPKARGAGSQ